MRATGQSEHQLQAAVAAFLDAALPADCWWSSIDHAGTSARHGALLKARGVRPGLPDLVIIAPAIRLTAWIELKTRHGRAGPAQLHFATVAMLAGHTWHICRSVAEVQAALVESGVGLRARLT